MLKNTGKSNSGKDSSNNENTHFSYDDYKRRVKKRSYKDFMVFISVLVIGILIFLGLAKILSPNVDVEIADNPEYSDLEEETVQGRVDERLKHLQAEDAAEKSEKDQLFTPELDEAVVLPKALKKTIGEMEEEMKNDSAQKSKVAEPKSPQTSNNEEINSKGQKAQETKQEAKAPISSQTYKVYVGSYATEKQAEVAKSIMQDAGIGISPILKNIGGTYTLQVGVYSSREKAQQYANSLLKSNFPARVSE